MTQFPSELPEEMLLGQFIPLHYHFNMLLDQSRMNPFQEAIDLAVPTDGTVLELGGGTGVLSWFAAQKARHVYCVERNPALVRAARTFLENNSQGDRVAVVQADAMHYLPPEPVDVVICEMLHVGLVREKQLEVIRSFKERYQQAFGGPLPRFIPDTTVLAVQPIEQSFCFMGYTANVPIFEPVGPQMKDRWLAAPHFYATIDYAVEYPMEFHVEAQLTMQRDGHLNAVSLLTNNFLAFVLKEKRAVQWLMNQLILPLPKSMNVENGDNVSIRFAYRAGCSLEALQESLQAELCSHEICPVPNFPLRRTA